MAEILLIRHSMTAGNLKGRYIGRTDESLCQEGRKLLEERQLEAVEHVYASPLKRCLETADLLFPEAGRTILENLQECDFGEFENKNYLELSAHPLYQIWVDSGGAMPFPSGEDPVEFRRRCRQGFEEIMADLEEKGNAIVAAVVHGGTIMSILEAYGLPEKPFYDWQVKNAGGYKLEVDFEKWRESKKVRVLGQIQAGCALE